MHRVHCYQDLPLLATSDELQLNFDYKRGTSVPAFNPGSPNSSSGSSDLSVPDLNLTLSSMTQKPSLWNAPPVFNKYIPISNPLALEVPCLLLNDKDAEEWEEAQAALVHQIKTKITCSTSDTAVMNQGKKKRKKTKKHSLHSLKRLFSCTSNPGNSPIKSSCLVVPTTFSSPTRSQILYCSEELHRELPKLTNLRFNFNANLQYIKAATNAYPQLSAALYGQLMEPMNLRLCKIKTELAASAMQSFFCPYSNVHCSWSKNLQAHILDQLQDPKLQAKFTRLVYLRRFDAMLVVSSEAGTLLRHKSLAFLHTLSTILQISPHKLLVLVKQDQGIEPKRLQLSICDDED